MEKLSSYLASAEISAAEFAAKVGTSRGYMHDLIKGRRSPSLKVASVIDKQSNGAVPITAWVEQGAA